MLFVLKSLSSIPEESRDFIVEECRRAKFYLDQAERRLEELEDKYEQTQSWVQTYELGAAHDNFERARKIYNANLKKLEWELRNEWMRKPRVSRKHMIKRWEVTPITWSNIFRRR